VKSIPIYDATAPIACSAGTDDLRARSEQIERMHDNLQRLERTADGLLLHFPNEADIDADVRRFVVDEKGCCRFWGFEITTTAERLTLRWDGPPTVEDLMDRLHAYFDGDEPLTEISGLL
jgi:hypothetical protein